MNANIICLGCRLIKAGTRVCCCPARPLVECAVPDWQEPLTASHDGTYVQLTVADWRRLAGGEERDVLEISKIWICDNTNCGNQRTARP